MLVISVVSSLILLLVASCLYRAGKPGNACCVSAIAIFFGFPCAMLPALMLTGAAICLCGLVCMSRRATAATFLKWSLAASIASHFIFGFNAFKAAKRDAELAAKYPLESMAERLAYTPRRTLNAEHAGQGVAVGPILRFGDTQSELFGLEERIDEQLSGASQTRNFYLRFLHDDVVRDFINSPGFGITRQVRPNMEYIELPPPTAISIPAPPRGTSHDDRDVSAQSESASAGAEVSPLLPSKQSLLGLHEGGLLDFVNPKGFGLIQDREHVRGFQVHHFRQAPGPAEPFSTKQRWKVDRLELVSLLAHEAPAVYVSEHLPRMDELRDAPTRPLSSFETRALSALERGNDLRFECSSDQILMLGSIRALKQCMTCHAAERGDLLGAFSYVLHSVSSP